MKARFFIVALCGILIALGTAGAAQAQSSFCSTVIMNPDSGPGGSKVTVSGTIEFSGDPVTVLWEGNQVASATADVYNHFSTTFDVPPLCTNYPLGCAAAGPHAVTVHEGGEMNISCDLTFTVDAAATPPAAAAPAATPATLPSTGIMLAPPAALITSGLGMFFYRRRR